MKAAAFHQHSFAQRALLAMLATAASIATAREDAPTRWTPAGISTDQYEATPALTPDGREMFFMLSDPGFARYRLMWSRCTNGRWSPPESPPFAASPPIDEGDPFLTADGKRLYFISSREARGDDDFDIWYVDREPDGSWRRAHRLPEPVNSKGSELLPRMTASGRLYFGSDRAGGFGKMDIYVAAPTSTGGWNVANVGPPVSTAASEYEADISRDERTLIVVADRGDRSHLYLFRKDGDGPWIERRRIPARPDVFQVGPLLSPKADRLLFAQVDGEDAKRSGEMFIIDLAADADRSWPPICRSSAPDPTP